MLDIFYNVRMVDVIDIVLVAFIIYRILLLIRGTRAVQIITGLALLFFIFLLSRQFGLLTFRWLVGNFLAYIIVIMVIIFQNEVRSGLAKIGRYRFFRSTSGTRSEVLSDIIDSVMYLSEIRRGIIIVLERDVGIKDHAERGTQIDGKFSRDMLLSITSLESPLHDGAIIISGDKIVAAGVILPIIQEVVSLPLKGARHRAALSITYESDALSIVVSEENGEITLYIERSARKIFSRDELELILFRVFGLEKRIVKTERSEGALIEPGPDERSIPREGLPLFDNPTEKGKE